MLHNETKLKSSHNPDDHVINPDKKQTFNNEPEQYQITVRMNLDQKKKLFSFITTRRIETENIKAVFFLPN